MHFEWNIYVRFELESWRNILMSTSQGTYVPIEQTSEAIRVTYEICWGGGVRTGIENRCFKASFVTRLPSLKRCPICRWVCFFIRTDFVNCSITLLAPVNPLQWMGAVRMSVQTTDKKYHNNPQVIQTTPCQQLTPGEVKNCLSVIKNKSIIEAF